MTGAFPASPDAQPSKGPVDLVKCVAEGGCGLVQLLQSYDLQEMYGLNYGYRSGLNHSMVRHLHAKVERILSMGLLEPGDLVIDVGSNDATTLRAYPEEHYELVGIDPTGIKFADYYPAHIRLISNFFSADSVGRALDGRKAKVITSFSMFYDLEDPTAFAREVAAALADDGIWVMEQSYLPTMLETSSFDTICHEHLEFYALKQIIWIAEAAGLKVLDIEFNDINGGSFSVTLARVQSIHCPNDTLIKEVLAREVALGLDGVEVFARFRERVAVAGESLLAFLTDAKARGERVCGLGASTKGNVLLQYFSIGPDLLEQIGEVNEDKFGKFTPGSSIPLSPEKEVLASNPDYLLVLPWHFRRFFESLDTLKGRRLVFPLPTFEVVQL